MKKRNKFLLLLSLILILCIQHVTAIPLVPEGGTGYMVSGSIEGGDISYTIIRQGSYEIYGNLTTTAQYPLTINTAGRVNINGNNNIIAGTVYDVYATPPAYNILILNISDIQFTNSIVILGTDGAVGSSGTTGTNGSQDGQNGGKGGNGESGGHGSQINLTITNCMLNGGIEVDGRNGGSGGSGGRGGDGGRGIMFTGGGKGGDGGNGGNGGNAGNINVIINQCIIKNEIIINVGKGGQGGMGGYGGKGGDVIGRDGLANGGNGGNGGKGGMGGMSGIGSLNIQNSTIFNLKSFSYQEGGNGGGGGNGGEYGVSNNGGKNGVKGNNGAQGSQGSAGSKFGEIYNNIIYQTSVNSDVTYYVSPVQGKNIIGGNYIAGNYWSNGNENGFSDKMQALGATKNLVNAKTYIPLPQLNPSLKEAIKTEGFTISSTGYNGDLYPLVDPSKIPVVTYN